MLSRSKEPWGKAKEKGRESRWSFSVGFVNSWCAVSEERILSVGSASLRQMGHPR